MGSSYQPDFSTVPVDDVQQNLEWRKAIRTAAKSNASLRKAIMKRCKTDLLYFINGWCFTFEPRPTPRILPFILWPHQVPCVEQMDRHLGICDIGLEKSRGEGATWMYLTLFFHRWLFHELFAFGLVSRTEEAVDVRDDPDSLMWKLDFHLEKLPRWMVPHGKDEVSRTYSKHKLINKKNGSSIVGYAAVGDVASGGRKTAFAMDELAKFPAGEDYNAMNSTQYVTDCRVLVSTPKGNVGVYAEAMRDPGNMVKIVLDWKDNPTRNQQMYKVQKDGLVVDVNPDDPVPDEYRANMIQIHDALRKRGFTVEEKLRSPWYDKQCLRPGATPHGIAQELDRDYGGSMMQLFGDGFKEKANDTCRSPWRVGALSFDPETLACEWDENPTGKFLVWSHLHASLNTPPPGRYGVACDVSYGTAGTYSSNSVICVINMDTAEQVAEFATDNIKPPEWAENAVAVCKWFHDARLIWEDNADCGQSFGARVIELGYTNIYYREVVSRNKMKRTKKPGLETNDRNKQELLQGLSHDVIAGKLLVRSRQCLAETAFYTVDPERGKIVHAKVKRKDKDTIGGGGHGDRVIALALANHLMKRSGPKPETPKLPGNLPYGTIAWRRRERKRREKTANAY